MCVILSDVDDLKDFVGLILRFMDFLGERVFDSWYGSPCSADWKFCEKGNVWSRDFLGFCWKP